LADQPFAASAIQPTPLITERNTIMKVDTKEMAALDVAPQTRRMDMYASIHKAMRAMMSDTLLAVGRMDSNDTAELANVSGKVLDLLDFCLSHLRHENKFVHTALEARAPGASSVIAHEHEEHEAHIARLKGDVDALCAARDAAHGATLALALYRNLALFIAENFQHMHAEETAHNAVLWARYTDAELIAIHQALVASIPPHEMMYTMRWLVPYMNPSERTAMLSDMQAHAPAGAFNAVLDVARPHLTTSEWAKLARSLGLPPVAGLVTV
jgi:iron-sulfur cluster repair protein YtfE (RIC family)